MVDAGPGGHRPADVLTGLLRAPLQAAGFDLEDIAVRKAGSRHVVAVAVDRDGGMDLDAVAEASRLVSDVLDARDDGLPPALRGPYTLEVASRGVDSPLTLPRHWRRAAGRLVEVRRRQGAPVTGRVRAADERGADLDVDGAPVRVDFADVSRALVQVEFSRPGAPDADEPPAGPAPGDGREARR